MVNLPPIRWVPDASASIALLCQAAAGGVQTVDGKLNPTDFVAVVDEIDERLLDLNLSPQAFWVRWTDAVIVDADPVAAVATAIRRCGRDPSINRGVISKIDRGTTDLWSIVAQRYPRIDEQLPLRIRAIKDQWDTYGRGLLKHVERAVWDTNPPDDWWPPDITARMVHPIAGGGGDVCDDGQSFWMEAVLTDVDPRLPEVLRAAWLAIRVGIGSHLTTRSASANSSESNSGGTVSIGDVYRRWSHASVPLLMSAAWDIGLADPGVSVADAMQLWQYGDAATAERVDRWWSSRDRDTPLPVSLRMLALS